MKLHQTSVLLTSVAKIHVFFWENDIKGHKHGWTEGVNNFIMLSFVPWLCFATHTLCRRERFTIPYFLISSRENRGRQRQSRAQEEDHGRRETWSSMSMSLDAERFLKSVGIIIVKGHPCIIKVEDLANILAWPDVPTTVKNLRKSSQLPMNAIVSFVFNYCFINA